MKRLYIVTVHLEAKGVPSNVVSGFRCNADSFVCLSETEQEAIDYAKGEVNVKWPAIDRSKAEYITTVKQLHIHELRDMVKRLEAEIAKAKEPVSAPDAPDLDN